MGEVLGIAGLMGAGRSELAKAIVGYDRRLAGDGRHERQTVASNDSPHAAIAAGIGFAPEDRKQRGAAAVSQHPRQCGAVRARQDLDASACSTGARRWTSSRRSPPRCRSRRPSLDELVSKLSGGNQQKVVLARWLARQPMLLILDEPTRGIDIGAKAEIYRLIDELAASGIGVILISSEMPELIGLADRVLVMADGRITAELARRRRRGNRS